jgi:hypothetical protein
LNGLRFGRARVDLVADQRHQEKTMHSRYLWPAGAFCVLGLIVGNPILGQTKKAGEVNTPPAKGERYKDSVKVGDVAPDFTLPVVKDKDKKDVTLSSFKDKKPVVLIFGSYT